MKIIWIHRVEVDGGTHITTWRETYKHLRAKHDIHYIFPYEKEEKGFSEQITYVPPVNMPYIKRLAYMIISFIKFIRLNREVSPDLVVLDIWSFYFSVLYLFSKNKPKIILDHRTAIYNEKIGTKYNLLNNGLKLLTHFALYYNRKFHDGATYISEGLFRQFQDDLKVKLHPVRHIWPSGVDAEMFKPLAEKKHDLPFSLFFHGGLTPNRGLAEMVEAMALLKQQNMNVRFTIAGAGKQEEYLKNKARELNVEKLIDFMGLQSYATIPALISKADLCMLTYPIIDYWEGNVPIKILEYMAMEKVVLCSELKVFRNITESSCCAIFIKDNHPESIAAGVISAIAKKEQLPEWGKPGRKIVESRFTWEAISAGLHGFFCSLVQNKKLSGQNSLIHG